MSDYTKRAFVDFLAMIVEKGLVNPNTGNGWKSASTKVLEAMDDNEDVRSVEPTRAVLMYNNRNRNVLAPASMKQYEIRIGQALENFKRWVEDPMGYRGPSRQTSGARVERSEGRRRNGGASAVIAKPSTASSPGVPEHPDVVASSELKLTIPFPLRSSFIAQVVIPRDLTKEEAKRLCAFVEALGHDAPAG